MRFPVSILLFALLAATEILGQYFLLANLGSDFARDHLLFVLAASVRGIFLFAGVVVIFRLALPHIGPRGRFALWLVAMAFALSFPAGALMQRYFQMSLSEGLSLALENFRYQYRTIPLVQVICLPLGIAAALGAAILAALFSRRWLRHWERVELPGWKRTVPLLLVCAFVWWVEPTVCPALASERACVSLARMRGIVPSRVVTSAMVVQSDAVLAPLPSTEQVEQALQSARQHSLKELPNLYLVIVDSLRADGVEPEGMPWLSRLQEQSLRLRTVAPSNCTHTTWFSLFSAVNPLYWKAIQNDPSRQGTVPLRLLKALGYRIHLWTTHSLEPYAKDKAIFGTKPSVLDTFEGPEELVRGAPRSAAFDREATRRFVAKHRELPPHGNLYILALFAPHWPYQWSEEFQPKWRPFLSNVTLENTFSRDVLFRQELRNRYRNAIAYVDTQLATIFQEIQRAGTWDNSAVVVAGDHGEGFDPWKRMVHCSGLDEAQLNSALAFKPPLLRKSDAAPVRLASPADIFPTFFDIVGKREMADSLFHGVSLLGPRLRSSVLSLNAAGEAPVKTRFFDGEQIAYFEWEALPQSGSRTQVGDLRLVHLDYLNMHARFSAPTSAADLLHSVLSNPAERWTEKTSIP